MITNESIYVTMEFYRDIKASLLKTLEELPKGHLFFKLQHGKPRPYTYINGTQKYLKRSKYELISKLMNRQEIERSLAVIDKNLCCLEELQSNYLDPWIAIPAQFDLSPNSNMKSVLAELESHQCGKPGYKNKHKTTTGQSVKSKSELLLFELFKSKGIEFFYENETVIDGESWFTDFKLIRNLDRKVFLWEHFGMMSNPEYAEQAKYKIYNYALNGYLPYENIIYTFDDVDGGIDMEKIISILRMMKFID